MQLTRRSFGAALAAAPALFKAGTSPRLDRPMRWFQLAFTEDDPGQCNVGYWLDYLTRINAEGVCLSAGGVVAFYPTDIPLHHRSTFLKDGDLFGEFVKECRKRGMAILARTDPHACRDDVQKAHPDWIHVLADGKPRRHWANPELWVTCALGPYNFEFMTEVTREIAARYDIDGVFSNRWSGHGRCYCEHCKNNYSPAWRQERLFAVWTKWQEALDQARPGTAMIPNTGGGALHDLDMNLIGERAAFLGADRQGRSGATPIWTAGKNAKEYRATMGFKPVAGLTSVGYEDAHRWKDSSMEPAEMLLWMADGVAQGLRPWIAKFNAKPYDERWMKPAEDFFRWHASAASYLRNTESLAQVAVVYSQRTARAYGDAGRTRHEDAILGAYQALLEARIPFDMMHESSIADAAALRRYRAIVLPNVALLDDAQCQALSEYAREGGGVVATFETSIFDGNARRRGAFGCAAMFGAIYDGTHLDVKNSYLNLDDLRHPLLAGFGSAKRIIHGVNQVHAEPAHTLESVPLTEVPSYPDLPMEDVWPRMAHTNHPGAYVQNYGDGRVVYFPFDLDRTFWEVQSPDHGRLLANAAKWVQKGPEALRVEGPGVIDVSVFAQERSLTVHLVNLTNPMLMRGPVRELMPVSAQKIKLRVPKAKSVRQARWLVAQKPAIFTVKEGVLETTSPTLLLNEVLAVDLA